MPVLLIAGDFLSLSFQEAKLIADDLIGIDLRLELDCLGMVEADWVEWLQKKKSQIGGRCHGHSVDSPLVFHSIFGYIGGVDEFVLWASQHYGFVDHRHDESYNKIEPELRKLSLKDFESYIDANTKDNTHQYATMKIKIGDMLSSELIFELYHSKCPKTVENFMQLCIGNCQSPSNEFKLHYLNSQIHRVVKDGWIQGGDIVHGKGNMGHSIYGSTFADECFSISHNRRGILSMANQGPHTNASQFFITLNPIPAFDKRYVAFGRLIVGFSSLDRINEVETQNQRPITSITIEQCGRYQIPTSCDSNTSNWLLKRQHHNQQQKLIQKRQQQLLQQERANNKNCVILVVGLDSSGKSSIIKHLQMKGNEPTMPTWGYELDQILYEGFNIEFHNLGGSSSIRGYWSNYYDDIHGVIYVIDCSDKDQGRIQDTTNAFHELINHPYIQHKPILIVANKQDVSNPISVTEAQQYLKLEQVLSSSPASGSPSVHIVPCTAQVTTVQTNVDPGLHQGIKWITSCIDNNYDILNERIKHDVAERKRKEKEKLEIIKMRMASENENK